MGLLSLAMLCVLSVCCYSDCAWVGCVIFGYKLMIDMLIIFGVLTLLWDITVHSINILNLPFRTHQFFHDFSP
jgi:hypothetical protein